MDQAAESLVLDQLLSRLRGYLHELCERYGVSTRGVFGSYVRGEQRAGSDLDLLVEFERVPTLLEFVDLQYHLSDLLGIKVDLVMKKTLKPTIGRHILEEVVPV